MTGRQAQRAGENSVQVQSSGDVHIGVSEERAREIVEATARSIIDEYANEGLILIQERITKLDDRVIASLIRAGRLEVFADPGFQRAYKKAQTGAAVSEEDRDYDLLAGLLADRAERGEDRRVRAGIERSIEVIDQLDDESLRGLTLFQAVQQYRPLSPLLEEGLDAMEVLLGQLVDGPLPAGQDWLDHLDVLDALRVDRVSSLKKLRDYFPYQMPGYLASGREKDNLQISIELNGQPVFVNGALVDHELRPGHVRLAAAHDDTLERTLSAYSPQARAEVIAQGTGSFGFGSVDPSLIDPYMERLLLRPNLKLIAAWWDEIPHSVRLTRVGRVLARANALRLDDKGVLPPID